MKCQGSFIFKTLTHRNAGVFKDSEGNEINYPSAYILKVDELMSNGDINERKFKIDDKETAIINGLKTLKAYQEIVINFEVTLYASRVILDIVDIEYEN
jgi:hypothetical protein